MDRRASQEIVRRAALAALTMAWLALAGCSRPDGPAARTPHGRRSVCEASGLVVPAPSALPPLELPAEARIARVVVRGNQRVPAQIVRRAISVRAGQALDPERVRADVGRIWELEVFDDVSVEYEATPQGIELVYRVVERPIVTGLRVLGDRAKVGELGVLVGSPYEPARLHRRARDLETSLALAGHPRATVALGGMRRAGGVELCVRVQPGPRITIERFEFSGLREVGAGELRSVMHTDDNRINTPGGVYRKDVLERDLLFFSALHYDRGLLSATTTSRVEERGDKLFITIEIDEGPVYRIGLLELSGERLAPKAEYLKLLGSARGDVFSRARMMEGFERIRELHRRRGRPDLDVVPKTELHRERGVVDVTLQLEKP